MKAVSLSVMVACLVTAALAVLPTIGTAVAQEAGKPVVNINATGEKIVQFGVVVKDVDKWPSVFPRFSVPPGGSMISNPRGSSSMVKNWGMWNA